MSGCQDRFNDRNAPIDRKRSRCSSLLESTPLARHIAHLFTRDPLVVYKERLHLDDERDNDHWENIQSTNWQTVR